MQYTPHYNLNMPEGTDIVNPLVQDNPNYAAIDAALYNNKLRVIGTATHVKVGTDHAITLGDSDINQFKFVATGDYVTGDTFSVDGVTVTPRIASGSSIPSGVFKINSTVLCILDGTVLNLINVDGIDAASVISDISTLQTDLSNVETRQDANNLSSVFNIVSYTDVNNPYVFPFDGYVIFGARDAGSNAYGKIYGADMSHATELRARSYANNEWDMETVFVKKGMKFVYDSGSGYVLARYNALI